MAITKDQIFGIIKMGRPFVLVAGLIAYLVGLSMAYYEINSIDYFKAIIGFIILMTGTLMGHYADEYADIDTDSLTRRTLYSGGSGVLPSGLVPVKWALYSALFCLSIAMIITGVSIYYEIFSINILLIVVPALIGGWIYSMPPFSLERKGLGEIDNAILGGFFMTLIGYTSQTSIISIKSIVSLIPIFLAVFVNLLGVHWADRIADKSVGKNTLVVKLGYKTKYIFYLMMFLLYIVTIIFIGVIYPLIVGISILITLPLGIYSSLKFTKTKTPMISSVFMGVVMLAMIIGYIFS